METTNPTSNQLLLFELPVSEAAIESFKIDFLGAPENEKISAKDKRRYYVHRALKDRYIIDPDKMTIDLPYSTFEEIPIGDRYYVNQLFKLGYNLQLIVV